MIAKDFEEFDSVKVIDCDISQYQSLIMFLEETTLKYMEIYNKGEF